MATQSDASPFASSSGTQEKIRSVSQPEPVKQNRNIVVTTEHDGRFMERNNLPLDDLEYPRNGSEPGLIVIINEEKFEKDKDNIREGTRRDVNELIVSFQRQGFNIDKENILHDATTEQIKARLRTISEMDLSDTNCLIVFFLTHGYEGEQLLTSDSFISTYDVRKPFLTCKTLEKKPKMFVFQACKGRHFSTTVNTLISEPSSIIHSDALSSTYMGPDTLVVYSTIEGNVSFRSSLTGTWFIQELCKNVTAYGKRDDVVSIITRITKCVSGNYYHNELGVNKKQLPVFMSTLSKKFYLNRNKDRAMVLMYKNYYQDIVNQVYQIKERVDGLASYL